MRYCNIKVYIQAYVILLVVLPIFSILLITTSIYANGAAGWSGLQGNEISISENTAISDFVVDEEVIIDGINNDVSVTYVITNQSKHIKNFKMVFPIEGDCKGIAERHRYDSGYRVDDDKQIIDSLIQFNAKLNGKRLPTVEAEPSDIKLSGEYMKLKDYACLFKSFEVKVLPGKNTLFLNYKIVSGIFQGDGVGVDWFYTYMIWPAKNWVGKFRHALWRVIYPTEILDIKYGKLYDDWFTGSRKSGSRIIKEPYRRERIEITAPGTRHDFSDHVDFTADSFTPSGDISIKIVMRELGYYVHSECDGADDNEEDRSDTSCILNALKEYMRIRPFEGSMRCYNTEDLNVIKVYMGFEFSSLSIPYLRNEIFARKGYIFKNQTYKLFYSALPWYKPKLENAELSDIEKWNVDFLKRIEDEVKPHLTFKDRMKIVENIYKQMKTACPASAL